MSIKKFRLSRLMGSARSWRLGLIKAVRAVITVRQQVMKHVTIVRQDAHEQTVINTSIADVFESYKLQINVPGKTVKRAHY